MHGASRVGSDQPDTGVPESATDVTPSAATPAHGLRGLLARFRGLVHELGKFGIVGGLTYVLDTTLLKLALSADVNPFLAKTLSTAVAATVAFLGNRYWTWRDRPRSGLHREYSLYFLFNIVGLGIGLACLGVSHYLLGRVWPVFTTELADIISANVVGMAGGTLFRFWSYRRFVFRVHSVTDRADVDEGRRGSRRYGPKGKNLTPDVR
ncbi:GtrA family protein [Planosporangium flavigriseum]|uniref:GtrA family protein n=1 Tax=Planosporangium flavigriseum TaxID=373681 RepID=UPI001EF3A1D0|nr:GtrA family protein [Planosporangium flavigriseum]